MSDHEADGLDLERWEEASLPGGSMYSYAPSESYNQAVVPGPTNLNPASGSRYAPPPNFSRQAQRGRYSETPHRGPQYPSTHGYHGRAEARQSKSPAEQLFDAGLALNGHHKLLSTWRQYRTMALRVERGTEPHPLLQVQSIMNKFGTFIRKPEDQDEMLSIWGEPPQVADTEAALAAWEQRVREAFVSSKPAAWVKSHALDGRAEHRLERQTKQKALNELLRHAQVDYAVEAALLWPKDLDMEEFEKLNMQVLDQLRDTFLCRIGFQTSEVQHVAIEANSELDAVQIINRVLNLIKENISRRDQLVMVNLVHLPDFSIYRDRVGLQDRDPRTSSYLPTLHGNLGSNEEAWAKERRMTHVSNRKKIKKTLNASIKRLRISQQHVRIRVVFGELGFTLFQKPAAGADTYSFEDFHTMVTKGRTKLTLNNLPVRQGDITDLPDILDSMDAFGDRTEYYGVFFDFPAATANTILRLDAVIYPSGNDDFEIREQRWVEFSDNVAKLQVSLFNFERPDFQVTVDAFPLYSGKLIKRHMQEFQNNISFERPVNGIKTLPRRHIKYPHGQSGLQTLSELTMVRWRFKHTDGFFELRRKDIYDERPGKNSPAPVETRWHAVYYYPEWDNLMGEFANVRPGEDITWAKAVATFFPESNLNDGRALPRGFKNFITEVEEIQDLLAEAIWMVGKAKETAA